MVKAHIKSPIGDTRTESWEEERLGDSASLLVNGSIYLISYFDAGVEQFTAVKKPIWDIHNDVVSYITGTESDYEKLSLFCHKALRSIENTFEEYVSIEKALFDQKLGDKFSYAESLENLEVLGKKSEQLGQMVYAPSHMIQETQPRTHEEMALKKLLLILNLFSLRLGNSVDGLRILLIQLEAKASGGKYGFLAYRKDTKAMQKIIKERQAAAVQLNQARDEFNALFKF